MSTAWITLATTDGYAIGALVLAQSLRNVQTQHKLHILYTNGVSVQLIDQLKVVFDDTTEVNVLDSNDTENLKLINRPDLGVTFTKLHCWRLTQYSKCVFLDADTFVLQNSDELFEHPEFSAAPDIGWPDYFNSGVFVFVPSEVTYSNLLQFALSYGSFDGGDQGLLNKYFHSWREQGTSHRLSFLYNVTSNAIYSYAAAIKRNAGDIKIIHFLGKKKPWHFTSDATSSQHLQQWQKVYLETVQQNLPISLVRHSKRRCVVNTNFAHYCCSGLSCDVGNVIMPLKNHLVNLIGQKCNKPTLGVQLKNLHFTKNESSALNDAERRYEAWEHGQPDYTGNDCFENIQKTIDKSLE